MNDNGQINAIIRSALAEDLGSDGDITSRAIFSETDHAVALIRSKESGICAGSCCIEPIFSTIDPLLNIEGLIPDGTPLEKGTEICRITGPIRGILTGERTALNFLQRLSGIATQTAHLVSLIAGTSAILLDTRKTTPGLRLLEKKAVRAGGASNHRFGLYDMILIKDTHVKAAGSPSVAVKKAKAFYTNKPAITIEVEVQSTDEFNDALSAGPDRIMLDNMTIDDMARCVAINKERNTPVELEASGNVSEHTIRAIAETGVNYISCGALTHSVKALDIHLILM